MTIDDEEPVLSDPAAEARRKSLPTYAEAHPPPLDYTPGPSAPEPGPLRTYIREEFKKQSEHIRRLEELIIKLQKLVG